MENLERFYTFVGANATEVVSRLGGNATLVKRFLMKFKVDDSYSNLCVALDNNDTETAFRAAHTLKGICANLGLSRLFEQASIVTEFLRSGATDEAKVALPKLEQEYEQVITALNSLNDLEV